MKNIEYANDTDKADLKRADDLKQQGRILRAKVLNRLRGRAFQARLKRAAGKE